MGAVDPVTCVPLRPNALTPNLDVVSQQLRHDSGTLHMLAPAKLEELRDSIAGQVNKARVADVLIFSNQTVDSAPGYRQALCLQNKLQDSIKVLLDRGLRPLPTQGW